MNKKLMYYLENFALGWSPFGGTEWNSSAKKLEGNLVKRGIKLPIKLYYQYALPDNMTNSKFMVRLAVMDFCANFSTLPKVKREIFFDKKLNLVEKFRLVRYIILEREESRKKMGEYVKFVQFANPELSRLKVVDGFDVFDVLAGAAFGFAPNEIAYFMNRKQRDLGREHKTRKVLERFGVKSGYVLAPETARIIIKELEKKR